MQHQPDAPARELLRPSLARRASVSSASHNRARSCSAGNPQAESPRPGVMEWWSTGVLEDRLRRSILQYSSAPILRCGRPLETPLSNWRAPCAPVLLEDSTRLAGLRPQDIAAARPPVLITTPEGSNAAWQPCRTPWRNPCRKPCRANHRPDPRAPWDHMREVVVVVSICGTHCRSTAPIVDPEHRLSIHGTGLKGQERRHVPYRGRCTPMPP